ncbi:MAG: type 1 glutamine amidotransferase, partial [Candidatus Magnetoovum sp. WYHC-5]|nr:type 1 glutamine amidotransferase [Candidatus Magnetoovum sp. WYHC-5]
MSVLILKNIKNEGPGTIREFLEIAGIRYKIVDLESEPIGNYDDYDTLVVMGGPMSVNDTDKYQYLIEEERVVSEFIANNKKVLGICLGSQMIAKCLGQRVYVGKSPEIGWFELQATVAGLKDAVFSKLIVPETSKLLVFQWHGETFDLPVNATRFAFNALYPNQAFKYANSVYAFQFHIEVD